MSVKQDTLIRLVEHQKTVYLGANSAEGYPQIKAMLAPRLHEGLQTFYLTTNTSSAHVAQYRLDARGCLYFCDQRYFRALMLEGTVDILEDRLIKERLWQDGDERYYSQGVTDPDYCVLRFNAQSGRFYSNFHSENITIS